MKICFQSQLVICYLKKLPILSLQKSSKATVNAQNAQKIHKRSLKTIQVELNADGAHLWRLQVVGLYVLYHFWFQLVTKKYIVARNAAKSKKDMILLALSAVEMIMRSIWILNDID